MTPTVVTEMAVASAVTAKMIRRNPATGRPRMAACRSPRASTFRCRAAARPAAVTAASVAEGLLHYATDAGRRRRSGTAARESLDARFARERYVGAWTRVFLESAGRGAGTRHAS